MMLTEIRERLISKGVGTTKYSGGFDYLYHIFDGNVDPIPDKIRRNLIINQLMLFASQFRVNIKHWDGSIIPINAISFNISDSGSGKDSSLSKLREAFKKGYDVIEGVRYEQAKAKAIKAAREKNSIRPESEVVWRKFYTPPTPLFATVSTNEGFISHLNQLEEDSIGAGFITSSELGSELENSPYIVPNLQLISELYDIGKREVRIIKDKDKQSKAINKMPCSALLMGSPNNILYSNAVKTKFKSEFNTKLARRSFFVYHKEVNKPATDSRTLDEILKNISANGDKANTALNAFKAGMEAVALNHITNSLGKQITITPAAKQLIELYNLYCVKASEEYKNTHPIYTLAVKHCYWKALKLAGAIALIFKQSLEITPEEYAQAIQIAEELTIDLKTFEEDLEKNNYEVFSDFANSLQLDSNTKYLFTSHELIKRGFIPSNTVALKSKELATLASSYDPLGIYTYDDKGIYFTKLHKTDQITISYIECKGTKEQRATKCNKGYKEVLTTFKDLPEILSKDTAYTPFKFKDGIRSAQTTGNTLKWIAFDIDMSNIKASDLHNILDEFNHHILLTSDKTNEYKYRLLIEFDTEIEVPNKIWKYFTNSIAQFFDLNIDSLAKSQIFYSYKGSPIYSTTDKSPLAVKQFLIAAQESSTLLESNQTEVSLLTDKQKEALWNDKLTTFGFAFNAEYPNGSISLIRAARKSKELGKGLDETLALIQEINDYWEDPMDFERLDHTILNQVRRWYEGNQ